ncbi:MAG: GNAT family N-acetyltransferase [Oscillospiraceae bacterium]|nr:GNAT family N-acetyltransferase [Oscillospiraceae bacterium]
MCRGRARPRVPACRPGDAVRSGRGAAVVCAVACVRGTRLHGRRHRRVFARVVSAASTHCGRSVQGGGVYKRRQMAYPVAEPRSPMPGIGRRLLEYGAEHYGIREVTVNEQNPQAVGFYEHMGFVTYKRTDRDEQGGPYPLLYMRRA